MYRPDMPKCLWARKFTEKILPAIASELRLGSDWTYQDLFLGMLEATAKMCRVPRNRVYTVEELLEEVRLRYREAEDLDEDLAFVKMICCCSEIGRSA